MGRNALTQEEVVELILSNQARLKTLRENKREICREIKKCASYLHSIRTNNKYQRKEPFDIDHLFAKGDTAL